MKKIYSILLCAGVLAAAAACNVMGLEPTNKVSPKVMLSSEDGVQTFMANLYYRAPFQDFGYNRVGEHMYGVVNIVGIYQDQQTDNAFNSEFNHLVDGGGNYAFWDNRYTLIRDINFLLDEVPGLTSISDEAKREIIGEAHYLRGWAYFDLAKRYGGVPIIDASQEYSEDPKDLRVPRSTEERTWDFVLEEFQMAADMLPETRPATLARRATKWTALGLQSRAALFAASLAKFGNRVSLGGRAEAEGYVGIAESAKDKYYQICIDAAGAIINSGNFSLYGADASDRDAAVKNLMAMFQDPNIAPSECMIIRGYGQKGTAHAIDFWCSPYQTRDGSPHPGRMNPSIDLVDNYECYSTPGVYSPVQTTEGGSGDNDWNGYDPNKKYRHFENAYDIFEDKDARLWATVILPFTEWKGQTIRIQNGFILEDGRADIGGEKTSVTKNGKTYYKFGADAMDSYSGYDQSNLSCMTRSGFSFKKFLSPDVVEGNSAPGYCTQDWAELRYAEILLNYAEAVVESGKGDASLAAKCLNETRRRAAFKTDIPLTVENVQRERRSELAFECKRWDDLIRRREFHTVFKHREHLSLDPILDMRTDPPQFIFVRSYAVRHIPLDFEERFYYNPIPGISNNGLVQNPQF